MPKNTSALGFCSGISSTPLLRRDGSYRCTSIFLSSRVLVMLHVEGALSRFRQPRCAPLSRHERCLTTTTARTITVLYIHFPLAKCYSWSQSAT
eukprot:scaffold4157_cov136-Cylindrotheca_fusiformis.AAC.15